jgi:hypothetical protein
MQTADVQSLVKTIAELARAAGASAKACEALDRLRSAFDPFRDWPVAQLADFLVKVREAYERTGTPLLPASAAGVRKSAGKGADPALVESALTRVRELYGRAVQTDYAVIDAALKDLDKRLTKETAVELARRFEIAKTLKSKKDALTEIRRKIVELKENYGRVTSP